MKLIETILNSFDPISLGQMEKVKLLNRMDKKFCFSAHRLQDILKQLEPHYFILKIENKSINCYKTLYYDTDDYKFYHSHHSGKLNRFKIRHRTYVENDKSFLEIKYKSNKDRTHKTRIANKNIPLVLDETTLPFIESKLNVSAHSLSPSLWVNYNRLTLVSKTSAERLTFDLNLEYIKNEQKLPLSNLIIAEVKQEKKQVSIFFNLMKSLHIYEGSISKYVMGIALTCPVKQNNFKSQLLKLSKITYANSHTLTSH